MKKNTLGLICVLISMQAFSVPSFADSSELLIKKFRKVKMQLAPNDSSMPLITLRLADLLSDKARKASMVEMNKGCVSQCHAGVAERKEALSYYKEAISKLPSDKKGKVLVQMGHLYQLNDQSREAKKLYGDAIAKYSGTELANEAKFSLAEIHFKERNFVKAAPLYDAVSKSSFKKRKGLSFYKYSWCEFNKGNIDVAIKGLSKILTTPELLTRSGGGEIVSVDNQFKEEVSRDLATFYTKTSATLADAKQIYQLSPESTRQNNIDYFASELERLGKKKVAAEVWAFVLNSQSDPKKRLEHHVRLAQLDRESGKIDPSLEHFAKSLSLWPQVGNCSEPGSCKELKSRLRKYILDWNRDEKNSSVKLVSAYNEYLAIFPEELDMILWGAQAAKKIKDWPQAEKFYLLAFNTKPSDGKESPSKEKILLMYVELAELSKDKAVTARAYKFYLSNSVEKSKFVDVKYQEAHQLYENKKYQEASVALKEIALIPGAASFKVKQQAADLALDALVILKKDQEIESWSSQFAKRFSGKSSEYLEISRKSILNQSAKISQNLDDPSAANKAWDSLSRIDLSGASESVKLNYYKNRMLLAEKLKRYDEMGLAANEILKLKTSSENDRQIALGKRAWLAELRLDFKSALKANEQLKLSSLSPSQKALKLAMLTELSGAKNNTYLDQFLRKTKDAEKAKAIATMKVEKSADKAKALKNYRQILSKHSELYASLHYKVALENNDFKSANRLIKNSKYANTTSGKSIWRVSFLSKFDQLKSKIKSQEINSENQNTLNRSLKKRVAHLTQLEKMVSQSSEKEDWLSQVVSVHLLAEQSESFYKELISLPMPEGLSSEQQQEYLQLLSQQASPYNIKAKELSATYKKFWANPNLSQTFENQLKNCTKAVCKRYQTEVSYLIDIAPLNIKGDLEDVLLIAKSRPERALPSVKRLEVARQRVREDPMNVARLNMLLSVEQQAGNQSMVSYLKERVKKIESSKESL